MTYDDDAEKLTELGRELGGIDLDAASAARIGRRARQDVDRGSSLLRFIEPAIAAVLVTSYLVTRAPSAEPAPPTSSQITGAAESSTVTVSAVRAQRCSSRTWLQIAKLSTMEGAKVWFRPGYACETTRAPAARKLAIPR